MASSAPYDNYERLRSAMKIGEHWRTLDMTAEDWAAIAQRLAIPRDQATTWVAELREALPGAFESAASRLPGNVRVEADRRAERIIDHSTGTWRPNLTRNPAHVLDRGEE